MLGILGGTLVSFLATAMSSSKNQKTCVVGDVQLPHTLGSSACLRIVSVVGEDVIDPIHFPPPTPPRQLPPAAHRGEGGGGLARPAYPPPCTSI